MASMVATWQQVHDILEQQDDADALMGASIHINDQSTAITVHDDIGTVNDVGVTHAPLSTTAVHQQQDDHLITHHIPTDTAAPPHPLYNSTSHHTDASTVPSFTFIQRQKRAASKHRRRWGAVVDHMENQSMGMATQHEVDSAVTVVDVPVQGAMMTQQGRAPVQPILVQVKRMCGCCFVYAFLLFGVCMYTPQQKPTLLFACPQQHPHTCHTCKTFLYFHHGFSPLVSSWGFPLHTGAHTTECVSDSDSG